MTARRVLTGAATALAVAAAVFALWGSWPGCPPPVTGTWPQRPHRDDALRAGREHVARLTTMDHSDVEAGLRSWLEVTTGPLRSELEDTDPATPPWNGRARWRPERCWRPVSASSTPTTARHAAGHGGVTTVAGDTEPVHVRHRYRAQLRHTDDGWKVAAFEPMPAGGAS